MRQTSNVTMQKTKTIHMRMHMYTSLALVQNVDVNYDSKLLNKHTQTYSNDIRWHMAW